MHLKHGLSTWQDFPIILVQDNTGAVNAILAQYNFIDIFPTNVSQIDLSYDNGDQIEEFTVEFQVNSWNRGTLAEPEEEEE